MQQSHQDYNIYRDDLYHPKLLKSSKLKTTKAKLRVNCLRFYYKFRIFFGTVSSKRSHNNVFLPKVLVVRQP